MRAPRDQASNLPPRQGAPGGGQAVVETPSGETAEVLSSGPRPRIYGEDTGNRDGLVAGTAVDEGQEPPAEAAAVVDRYVVLRDATFTHRGHRVKMNVGKVVDSLNYDVKHLLRQGVRMKKLEDGEDGTEHLGAERG